MGVSVEFTRRKFIAGLGIGAAANCALCLRSFALDSRFRVSVITDEISDDFDHACQIAAQEFGLGWVELRSMWNKNVLKLGENEVNRARKILERYKLRVTDIASPLFKVDLPDAPRSKSPERETFRADFTSTQQGEVLERSLELARVLNTDRVRCFDFWRLHDQSPYRAEIDTRLCAAADKAGKNNIILVLENEPSCNTATGAELARTLGAVQSPYFMCNWDPGNAAASGEVPYPNGYDKLPKNRIGHVHCKDARKKASGSGYEWAPMGEGIIDWCGQFQALKRDAYQYAVSLETHWQGAGTPEESTRQSMAGMKRLLKEAG